jgi:hypothetical protein
MDFEKARAIRAGYDLISKRQRYKHLQAFMIEGARAREEGKGEDDYPYHGKANRQERTWWRYGWQIMNGEIQKCKEVT